MQPPASLTIKYVWGRLILLITVVNVRHINGVNNAWYIINVKSMGATIEVQNKGLVQ